MLRRAILILLSLLILTGSAAAENDFRRPIGHINDFAGLLSAGEIAKLEQKARGYAEVEGHEIAVLIVESLNGRSIEDFAYDVFNQWRIGKNSHDNGVLFVIALQERRTRIEVGYGLEDKLTDLEAGRLVGRDSPMAQNFRNRNYYAGIDAVIGGIIEAISGDYNPPPERQSKKKNKSSAGSIVGLIFFLIVMFLLSRRGGGGKGGRGINRKAGWFVAASLLGSLSGKGGSGGGGFSGGGFGGFGGGFSGGGGASGGW
jgi:uncharacterized protein